MKTNDLEKKTQRLAPLFGLFSLDIQQVNFSSASTPLILLALVILIGFLVYKSHTRLGFYLRKKIPLTFLGEDTTNYKNSVRILFVDDQDVQIAETLRDEGWQVAKARDARVDDQRVKDANIIFVDWRGVGRRINAEEEGISLVANLKMKYGHNKYIILYSAQEFTRPADIMADDWINKGSDSLKYFQTIQKASFSLFG